jgi:peptidoglycan L-alanyl-D-glutamate endopeptidase CwlK
MFKLSQRSINNLKGTKPQLQDVVSRAIQLTEVDFVVIEGLRSIARQQELVNQGASQTMNSKHITGDAVDLAAWLGTIRWELPLYFKIAEAMKQAAIENNVAIRWGGAWTVPDIRTYSETMEHAHEAYLALRRSQGRRAFIDAPHFELM